MSYERLAGILLHPTSLPGPDGIGDLGPESYRWIDFLSATGCGLWQILPLGPTGFGDSPYQCFSAFAGNPYLVSPALLLDDGLLTRADPTDRPSFPSERVDYGPVIQWKLTLLDRAFARLQTPALAALRIAFEQFCTEEDYWLRDYALFMTLKDEYGGLPWNQWPQPLRQRQPQALESFWQQRQEPISRHCFRQFLFFRQWKALRAVANRRGIRIIGDIPIFVAADSADAWSHPELFYFDAAGQPKVVAGVPPDYFSATGQLWGNPLYNWRAHRRSGYAWWIERFKATLNLVDIIRLDHFRGFAGYWEIPAGKPTAEVGRWVTGPGADFFTAIQQALHGLPLIAEDLGEITSDVIELRERFHLPGMKVFQFAFASDADDPFLPHNYPTNCVAYTGTHDNDTTIGWYQTAPEVERDFCRRYLARSGQDVAWDMIRGVWSSVAAMTLAPMQDFLRLGGEARMNFPGRPSGNWTWRLSPNALSPELGNQIRELNHLYGRNAAEKKTPTPPKAIKMVEADE